MDDRATLRAALTTIIAAEPIGSEDLRALVDDVLCDMVVDGTIDVDDPGVYRSGVSPRP